ncbi:MAG TPA: CHAD domain-containing protein [Verrucomicrobiae bacterium]|nr:CHAD domain-containing protein [Verrucomicrobiae bacterium]
MAFHFKKKESPTRAARRLSRERIGKALDHLRKHDRLEAVHRVRKEIKKIRATLELVREGMEGNVYRRYTKMLRAVAKRLRNPRDAHVRPRTLERLVAHFQGRLPVHPFSGIKKVLRRNSREETCEFLKGKSLAAVDRLLRKMNRRTGDLKVKTEGWSATRPGLFESYRRGQKSLAVALKEPSPENLHEWRKHVQDLCHQLRLLCPIQPQNLRASAGELKTLSQYLGDDHDLVMLQRFVTRRCARKSAEEVKRLNELIELRQNSLRSAALALGARFYGEKPFRFCERLENYWRVWRAGKGFRFGK